MFFDIPKIVYHVHSVMCFITFGNLCYEFAGKLVTFIAEFHLIIQKLFTFLLNKRALLISRTTTNTVGKFDSFRFSIINYCKIITAQITVHTTRCNQFRFQVNNPSTVNINGYSLFNQLIKFPSPRIEYTLFLSSLYFFSCREKEGAGSFVEHFTEKEAVTSNRSIIILYYHTIIIVFIIQMPF